MSVDDTVRATLDALGVEYEIFPCDPALADTTAFSCDGTSFTATAACTFADDGSYTVYGRVSDKDGGTRTYSALVTVNNVAPTAVFAAHQRLKGVALGNFRLFLSSVRRTASRFCRPGRRFLCLLWCCWLCEWRTGFGRRFGGFCICCLPCGLAA